MYVPFNPTSGFIGRADELERLQSDRRRIVSILGLGGVGKSRLALEFAFQVKSARPEDWIFWIEATDQLTFEKDVLEIGKKLRIPGIEDEKADVKNLVKQRLSDSTERWLLVLDNADDDALWGRHAATSSKTTTLVQCLPRTTNGLIIVTTRTPSVAAFLAGKEVIELSMMSPNESVEMFTQALRKPHLAIDRAATVKLLEKLAYLPIAIVQAASYLNMTGRPVYKYLELLDRPEEEAIQLLSKDFGDSTRYANANNPVATTWLISLNHIRKHHELAAKLLSSMVCLNEKSIPRSLLPETKSELDAIDAIAVLTGYSFVSRQTGSESLTNSEEMYDLHRIVHLAGRNWLRTEGSLTDWTKTTIERIAKLFPTRDQENKSLWTTYLPHARRLCDNHECENVPARYQLLERMGLCFVADGKYDEAVNAHSLVVQWREKTLGASDRRTLNAYSMIGEALNMKGDWSAAEAYLQKAIEGQKGLLTSDHPDTLISMTDLASTYESQGRWTEAEALTMQVYNTKKRVLGEGHSLTLNSKAHLALIYCVQGRWKDSEELQVQVMNAQPRTLGLEHPLTLATMSNLAATYWQQGRWKEAEDLFLQVQDIRTRVFGADHPDTLTNVANLASTYQEQGRWAEAEKLQKEIIEIRTRVLKEEHPDTLSSTAGLALTYQNQGRWNEAEVLFLQVIEIRKRVYGEEHPVTLTCIGNLASTYWDLGRYQDAEMLGVQVTETMKRTIGAEHPWTLTSMGNLAFMYSNQGRWKEAEKLFIQVMETKKKVLGVHPSTRTTMANLASMYRKQGRRKEAKRVEMQEKMMRESRQLPENESHRISTLIDTLRNPLRRWFGR